MVLVGRGSVRESLRVAIAGPVLFACVSLIGVVALVISDPDMRADPFGLVFVVLIGTLCGLCGSIYWFLWVAAFAGRVRYYVDGSTVIVRRGNRTVASKDMSTACLIRVDGWVDTRRGLLRVGPRWTSSSGLPHVYLMDRSAGAFTKDYELPDVFIWGRDGADKFRQAVFSELAKSGIDQGVFADE
ncbi:MAG: hypothetical protein JWR55_1914 [Aeromicrobium sp.]|nr:hypothetical protein [Aeromicrobium sp.]